MTLFLCLRICFYTNECQNKFEHERKKASVEPEYLLGNTFQFTVSVFAGGNVSLLLHAPALLGLERTVWKQKS